MAEIAPIGAPAEMILKRKDFSVSLDAHVGLLRVQVFHRKSGAVEQYSRGLGLDLPGPNMATRYGDKLWLWSAPGEWLVAVPPGSEREVRESLAADKSQLLSVVSVVTDSRSVFHLLGNDARQVLARGSNIDFHQSSFGRGASRVTRLAGISVLLANLGDTILTIVDASYTAYMLRWLEEASLA